MPIFPNFKFTYNSALNKASATYMGGMAAWSVYKLITKKPVTAEKQKTPWRPPQWKGNAQVQLIEKGGTVHIFDAVLRLGHTSEIQTTSHPIQSGANIVDHAYQEPERLVLEIGMSDVMDSYQPGRWKGYESKSQAAFQKLKELQYLKIPFYVQTRLNYYENMVIKRIDTPDDYTTLYGLKCLVQLQQIMTVEVSTTTVKTSTRKHATGKTPRGHVQPQQPDTAATQVLKAMGIEK